MGCLAPRLVEGPATALSLSSESLELESASFTFFRTGGLAGGDGGSDSADFLAESWASLGSSERDIEWSTFFLFMEPGAHAIGGLVGIGGSFSITCSSSFESSVAESFSRFVLNGPAWGRSCNLVPAGSSQSRV